ncbi:MAG: DUF3376 domain-containing protein [Solirubrobacterales bacterium]
MAGGKKPELRLGLVLYGGVSLAVYIYGVVVEVQRLLRASAEHEGAQSGEAPGSAGYADALDKAGLSRASVDIVAGTSAGGINGILLAKALASGGDVEAVRKLWIEQGDIGDLLRRLGETEPESLLSTEVMEGQLAEGFGKLDGGGPSADGALDLFVSATHLRGDLRHFEDSLGAGVESLKHRYVFQLKRRPGYGRDDFARPPGAAAAARSDGHLVKLSRATSAFPVAFEPVKIDAGDGVLDPRDEPAAWFADGGILNNKPFTETLQTIFTRSSDRPVRRWLISVDPDPKPLERPTPPGPKPAFDQIAVSAIAQIPRYQSIAGDLEGLEEHNEAVRRIAILITDLERELSSQGPPPLGAAPTSYRRLRARAFAEEIADWLLLAAWPGRPRPFEPRAIRRAFVDGAYSALKSAGWEGEGWRELPDLAFELRRAYYLIKLVGMAVELVERREGAGARSDLASSLRLDLWAAFESIRNSLWRNLAAQEIGSEEGDGADAAKQAFGVARARVGEALDRFEAVRVEVGEVVASALAGVVVVLAEPTEPEAAGGEQFEVLLGRVFEGFDYRDSLLLPIEVGGGLRHRDLVQHAQISPAAAASTGVAAAKKLAGDTAGHFGGFLDVRWRENDLLWGRLDAAEILVGAIMSTATEEERAPVLEAVQREILAVEKKEALEDPDVDWRTYLDRHAIGEEDISTLPKERIDGLKARAGFVLRAMLRKAAIDAEAEPPAPKGKLRRRLLGTLDNTLKWAGRILWLWVRARRRQARKSESGS